MTILVCYHFSSFANFRHHCFFCIHWISYTDLRVSMEKQVMFLWNKVMYRRRYINNLLKGKADIVHSRHRSMHNFIMNVCVALTVLLLREQAGCTIRTCKKNPHD